MSAHIAAAAHSPALPAGLLTLLTPNTGCADVPPSADYTCAQQAAWGKCGADFVIAGGFCAATCGRCTGGVRPIPDFDKTLNPNSILTLSEP